MGESKLHWMATDGSTRDLEAWFRKLGAVVEYGEAKTKTHRFRVVRGGVQAAVAESFDRWANSVDFVFPRPRDETALAASILAIEEETAAGNYDDGWGAETLVSLRTARRRVKAALRKDTEDRARELVVALELV